MSKSRKHSRTSKSMAKSRTKAMARTKSMIKNTADTAFQGIKTVGSVGISAYSLLNTGYRQLSAPLSVAATDGTLTTGVTVTWTAASGATGYQVWRAIGVGVAAQIGTVGAVVSYSCVQSACNRSGI